MLTALLWANRDWEEEEDAKLFSTSVRSPVWTAGKEAKVVMDAMVSAKMSFLENKSTRVELTTLSTDRERVSTVCVTCDGFGGGNLSKSWVKFDCWREMCRERAI